MRQNLKTLLPLLMASALSAAALTVFVFLLSEIPGGFIAAFLLVWMVLVIAFWIGGAGKIVGCPLSTSPDAFDFSVLVSQAPQSFYIRIICDGKSIQVGWVDDDNGYGATEAMAATAYALHWMTAHSRLQMRLRLSPEMWAILCVPTAGS